MPTFENFVKDGAVYLIPIENPVKLMMAIETKAAALVFGKEGIMEYMIAFKEINHHLCALISYKIPGMEMTVMDCSFRYGKKFPTIPGGKEVNQKIKSIYDKANGIYKEMTMNV